MSIYRKYTNTYNYTLTNVLQLNVYGRRDHKPQTLCVCVLCSHDAVCDAPAVWRTRGTAGRTKRERTYLKRRDGHAEILQARSDAPFTISARPSKNQTQPQRKHNYIVGFRNGAAKTSTDDSIVYKQTVAAEHATICLYTILPPFRR